MIKKPVKGKIYWAVFWKDCGKSIGFPPHIVVPVSIFAVFDKTDEIVEIIEPFIYNDGSAGSHLRLFSKNALFETKEEAIEAATAQYYIFITRDMEKMYSFLQKEANHEEK